MEWLSTFMSWEWAKLASSLGLAGILAGTSKSFVDHWINGRKELAAYRRAKLAEWREVIHKSFWPDVGDLPAYAELRQHMSKNAIYQVEHPRMLIVPGGRGGDARKQILLDELARLERKWGLI